MKYKILIVGSTGKLGTKLLKFTKNNFIPIYGITCYKNSNKLINQKRQFLIKNFRT